MVDPLADRSNMRKPVQSVKVLSVDGLKKALRFALHSPNMFIAFAVLVPMLISLRKWNSMR